MPIYCPSKNDERTAPSERKLPFTNTRYKAVQFELRFESITLSGSAFTT